MILPRYLTLFEYMVIEEVEVHCNSSHESTTINTHIPKRKEDDFLSVKDNLNVVIERVLKSVVTLSSLIKY